MTKHIQCPNLNIAHLDNLISFIKEASQPITKDNYQSWLHDLAAARDPLALCPTDRNHACYHGLGSYLGILSHGHIGITAMRLGCRADAAWIEALIAAPSLEVQQHMYVDLLTGLRDTGALFYNLPDLASFSHTPSDVAKATA